MEGKNQFLRTRCPENHDASWDLEKRQEIPSECATCGNPVFITHEGDVKRRASTFFKHQHSFLEYIGFLLPDRLEVNKVTLGEGNTPFLKGNQVNLKDEHDGNQPRIHFKDESSNPTKSYRDRGAALLVAHAVMLGYKDVCCASSGNMGASIAAYAAKAGISAKIFSDSTIDEGKKSLILAFGGKLDDEHATLDDAVEACVDAQISENAYQATAELNPLTMVAQKTIAYEIIASGLIPDEIYVPLGNGGTLFSIWQGFNDLKEWEIIPKAPRMVGAALEPGSGSKIYPLIESSGLSLRTLAEKALHQSKGTITIVTDAQVTTAMSALARGNGLFVEPASAAAYAAMTMDNTATNRDATKVIILTGTGLKTPSVIDALFNQDIKGFRFFHGSMNLRLKILEQISKSGRAGLHGYAIYTTLKSECSKQAVYMHLHKLERKNFIKHQGEDEQNRKMYEITEKGREVLDLLQRLVQLL